MTINRGLGDPKRKVKTVLDGQPVNIPAHPLDKLQMTQPKFLEGLLDSEAE